MLNFNLILISELLAIGFRMLLIPHALPTPQAKVWGDKIFSESDTFSSILDDRNTEGKDMDLCTKLFSQTKLSLLTPVCFT